MSNLNQPPIVFANPATTGLPGVVQLAGDLGGTYLSPLVLKLNGVTLPAGAPSVGQALIATSPSALGYGSVGGTKRVVSPSYSPTLAPNGDTTDIFRVTLTGNLTLNVPTGTPSAGQTVQVELTQDGTGSRLITFGSGYSFSTDIPSPALSTAANKSDLLVFQYNAVAGTWRLVGLVKGF